MISVDQPRKANSLLFNVLIASAVIHLVIGLVLGGMKVVSYIVPDKAHFEEPPEVTDEQPPPDVKVKIKPSPRVALQGTNDFKTRQVGSIAVASIAVDLPSMEDSFNIRTRDVGNFNATSKLVKAASGQLDFGTSQVNVFGIKAKAERILFVIDTNRQMVTDKKGGLNSYRVIKEEITDMVGNLNAGTLFNVMLQDRTKTLLFKPKLVTAGSKAHGELVKWVTPINSNAEKPGLEGVRGAQRPTLRALTDTAVYPALRLGHRGNETVFITQHALEQGIDTIFFITGYHKGFEAVRRDLNKKEEKDWQKKINRREYKEQLAEHQKEVPVMQQRVTNELNRINAERKKQGQPPRVLEQRHGVHSNANELGLKWKTRHPGSRPHPLIEPREIKKYLTQLNKELYVQFDRPVPSINVVLFLAEDEAFSKQSSQQLKDYVSFYEGKHRIIRGEKEIKSARTSKNTKN